MDHIPEMPDDFFPEIIVMAKEGNIELAYAVTKEMFKYADGQFKKNVNFLRWAIWQCKNDSTRHKMITEPNTNLLDTRTELRPQG